MAWQGFKEFVKAALSENGVPSTSRILSVWLSVSSMALIWWMVRHAMLIDNDAKLLTWVGGIPSIIYALAAFAVSPYGFTKIAGIFKKDKNEDTEAEEKVGKVVEKIAEKVKGRPGTKG
jgi:hypothetical protein